MPPSKLDQEAGAVSLPKVADGRHLYQPRGHHRCGFRLALNLSNFAISSRCAIDLVARLPEGDTWKKMQWCQKSKHEYMNFNLVLTWRLTDDSPWTTQNVLLTSAWATEQCCGSD